MARILAVGTNPDVMTVVERLLRSQEGWMPTVLNCAEEALAMLRTETARFDVLLLGAGLAPEQESALKTAAEALRPPVPVVAHYGGGSGLLFAEIWGVLGR
jgi:DNA-binding NtrC family response regulator